MWVDDDGKDEHEEENTLVESRVHVEKKVGKTLRFTNL